MQRFGEAIEVMLGYRMRNEIVPERRNNFTAAVQHGRQRNSRYEKYEMVRKATAPKSEIGRMIFSTVSGATIGTIVGVLGIPILFCAIISAGAAMVIYDSVDIY